MSSRQPPSPTPTVASQDEEMTLPETFLASRPYPCRQRPGPNSNVHEITRCFLMLLLTRSLQANNNHWLAQATQYTYTRSTHAYIHRHAQHTPSTSYHTYQQHTDNLQGHSQESTNSTVNIETRSRHRPCLATELSAARMLSASPSSQLPLVTAQLRSRNYLSSTCTSHNREETLPDKIRPSSPHAHAWTSGRTLYDQEPRCSRDTQGLHIPTLTTHNHHMVTLRRQHTTTHDASKVSIAKEHSHTPVTPSHIHSRTNTIIPSQTHRLSLDFCIYIGIGIRISIPTLIPASVRHPSSFLPHTPASLKEAPVRNSHDREGTMPDNIRRPSSSHTYALTSGCTLTTRNQEQNTQASRLTHTHLTTYNYSLATIHRIHIHNSQQ
ncbi:hypothetical protein CF319_g5985 [Tilletia indica]|nr:hypothetical protein CF319_g5985 [Tilletia indica]